jgi:hypothetical protein
MYPESPLDGKLIPLHMHPPARGIVSRYYCTGESDRLSEGNRDRVSPARSANNQQSRG